MSKTAIKLIEIQNRKPANVVCATMQDCTLRLLADRIFSGFYF
jgi:hypothetical protein